jgi:hypothetical protein
VRDRQPRAVPRLPRPEPRLRAAPHPDADPSLPRRDRKT